MSIHINKCCNNHFWVKKQKCPFCGEEAIEKVEYQKGDCVACGSLCPERAYCCTNPAPIHENESNSISE